MRASEWSDLSTAKSESHEENETPGSSIILLLDNKSFKYI
jgi:hypothetical protein